MGKKILTVFICTLMCCIIGACGKEPTCSADSCEESVYKNDMCKKHYQEDVFVGTWYAEFERQKDEGITGKKGDKITCTIEVYKGGTGRIYWTTNGKDGSNVSIEWEVNDDCDVLALDYSIGGHPSHVGFEYNAEDNTMIKQDARDEVYSKQ